jgi:small subunit ribosomal protein S20
VANTKSAEKRNRQSQRRQARNSAVKSTVRTAVKKAREAMSGNDPAQAKSAVVQATRTLAKAGSKGVMHKRAVSRRLSRLAKQANRTAAAK